MYLEYEILEQKKFFQCNGKTYVLFYKGAKCTFSLQLTFSHNRYTINGDDVPM